jgi:ribosome-interacting GTPase 1
METSEEKIQKIDELKSEIEDIKKETHEEKLHLVEDLKSEISKVKSELSTRKRKLKKYFVAGALLRTGIVLLVIAIGIGLVAYFL